MWKRLFILASALLLALTTGCSSGGGDGSGTPDAATDSYRLDSDVSITFDPPQRRLHVRYGDFPGERILLILTDLADAVTAKNYLLSQTTQTPPRNITFVTVAAMPCTSTASPEDALAAEDSERRGDWVVKKVTTNGTVTEVAMAFSTPTSGPDCKSTMLTGFEPEGAGIIHEAITAIVDSATVDWGI